MFPVSTFSLTTELAAILTKSFKLHFGKIIEFKPIKQHFPILTFPN